MFVTGLGGASALSNAAAASASPAAASNYDAKVGPAFSVGAGYHFSDWFSAQTGYSWNRNRITATEVAGSVFRRTEQAAEEHALGADLLLYFRPRASHLRPYLSAGPVWLRALSENRIGLRVAVGVDLTIKSGWGVRYTFHETMSANPFGAQLRPPGNSRLMNFQNLWGLVKVF